MRVQPPDYTVTLTAHEARGLVSLARHFEGVVGRCPLLLIVNALHREGVQPTLDVSILLQEDARPITRLRSYGWNAAR